MIYKNKKGYVYILILVVLVLVLSLFFNINRVKHTKIKYENILSNKFDDKEIELDFDKKVKGLWKKLYIFEPYITKEEIIKQYNLKWKDYKSFNIKDKDNVSLLLFVDEDNNVKKFIEFPREKGDFLKLEKKVYDRYDSKFMLFLDGGKVKHKFSVNEVYKVFNSEGIDKYKDVKVSTMKNNYIYIGKYKDEYIGIKYNTYDIENTVKGPLDIKVDIVLISNDKEDVLLSKIDFVKKSYLDDNILVLQCLNNYIVYDIKANKKLIDEIGLSNLSYNKKEKVVYTQKDTLVNCDIVEILKEKIIRAYETKKQIYFKGILDDNYSYATFERKFSSAEEEKYKIGELNEPEYYTVIINDKGEIVSKDLSGRIFIDSYKKSLLEVGINGYSLFLVKDYKDFNKNIKLTNKYVYSCGFLKDGYIYYVVQDDNKYQNDFELHMLNDNGKEIWVEKIKGTDVYIQKDGIIGFIADNYGSKVVFNKNKIDIINTRKINKNISDECIEIKKLVREAVILLYEKENNKNVLKKYFANIDVPVKQVALDDVLLMSQEHKKEDDIKQKNYEIRIIDYDFYNTNRNCSIVVNSKYMNDKGRVTAENYRLELSKIKDKWFIVGFSTFPRSNEINKIKGVLQLRSDNLLNNCYIGQVQFWKMSMPHKAIDIKYSNHAKVYINKKGEDTVISTVILKKEKGKWKVESIYNSRNKNFFR